MSKGGGFERSIAKQISLWFSNGKQDDLFYRTAGSGGRATQRAKAGRLTVRAYGDIKAETKEAEVITDCFCFELKKGYTVTGRVNKGDLYAACDSRNVFKDVQKVISKTKKKSEKISVLDFIDSAKQEPLLIKWWKKAEETTKLANSKYTLIIFQRDSKAPCVMFSMELLDKIHLLMGGEIIDRLITIMHDSLQSELVLVSFRNFFDRLKPETVKDLMKTNQRRRIRKWQQRR